MAVRGFCFWKLFSYGKIILSTQLDLFYGKL